MSLLQGPRALPLTSGVGPANCRESAVAWYIPALHEQQAGFTLIGKCYTRIQPIISNHRVGEEEKNYFCWIKMVLID